MLILVVEDDPVPLKVVCRVLENLGHSYITAPNGQVALSRLDDHDPDVIISDWQMPHMDGIELCRRVREREARYIYFIMLTSNTTMEEQLAGLEAGADDYLSKPLQTQPLLMRLIVAERIADLHRQIGQQQQQLETLNQKLFTDGRRCALTGISNRLQLDEDLTHLHSLASRHQKGFCLAIFDIDSFKKYNDTCGHVAGDKVLQKIAQAIDDACRSSDKVYRYGGEEFVAIYQLEKLGGGLIAAERMRTAVEDLNLAHPALGSQARVTISGGVTQYFGSPPLRPSEIIAEADKGLYAAKSSNKNKVLPSPSYTEPTPADET